MRRKFIIYIITIFSFLANTLGPLPAIARADEFVLPKPGVFVPLSPAFNPPVLKGLKIHPDNPFRFDFIVNKGDLNQAGPGQLKAESQKLIKYFLASLTIPGKDLWVNLSPYEKDRIIPPSFGLTGMGRDLLAEDYMLKQITASLIYPDSKIGKKFWQTVYEKAEAKFHTTNIPINTFNKVWIVPAKAVIYENAGSGTVYILESKLNVMLEQDYEALKMSRQAVSSKSTSSIGSQIVREIVIPELIREVNEDRNFAQLRQVYNSLILAIWYKKKIRASILERIYINQNKVQGVHIPDGREIQRIYGRYLQAFKRGVYNYIKEDIDPVTHQSIPKKYFSGGANLDGAMLASKMVTQDHIPAVTLRSEAAQSVIVRSQVIAFDPTVLSSSDDAMISDDDAQDGFIKQVLLPVLGRDELPQGVNINQGEETGGDLWITLDHKKTEPISGKEVHFRYRIKITSTPEIRVPDFVSLNEENVLEIPKPSTEPWDEHFIQALRYSLRRLMIADPINGRFTGNFQLDPYQVEAIAKISTAFDEGHKALAVMATATGKTVVAFNAINEHLDKIRAKGGTPGAVLFIVNNNIILDEAEKKLKGMFPGKYTTSQIYDRTADYSGDIIFATPSSLSSQNRIEALLAQRKISMVVFDEVHHVPAENMRNIYRRIEEESILKQSETKFLGLTATEIRPDRVSVISLFERNIVFEYMIGQGQREGSLVPLTYVNADKGYPAAEGDLNPILPGDPRWDAYKEWRYARERYPDLFRSFQEQTENLLDKRGLILAPTIEKAQELALYFRTQGVAAVSLTGADRTDDPQAFKANYEAWKAGQWPDGSPYQGRPVPQVVVAVDIFREGIDVPAINAVMLWSDTNSSIEFLQAIGRGLRLAPFKTKLIVIDAIGLYRKLGLLKALGGSLGRGSRGDEISAWGPRVHKSVVIGDTFASSSDVTKKLDLYLNAIPDVLFQRYETYANIPVNQLLDVLDPWLAYYGDFVGRDDTGEIQKQGVEAFYRYLSEFAEKLFKGEATAAEKRAFRDKFVGTFHAGTTLKDDLNNSKMPIQSEQMSVRIVYYRLFELLNRRRAEEQQLKPEMLDDIFPEFSEREKAKLQNRAINIRKVRVLVFNADPMRFFENLDQNIIRNPEVDFFDRERKREQHPANEEDGQYAFETLHLGYLIKDAFIPGSVAAVHRDDLKVHLEFAEGVGFQKRRSVASLVEGQVVEDKSAQDQMFGFTQITFTRLLSYHPTLRGIAESDYELPPEEFLAKLRELGLLKETLSFPQVLNRLEESSQEYSEGAEPASREQARARLISLLTNNEYLDYFQPEKMTSSIVTRMLHIAFNINKAVESLGGDAQDQDRQVRDIFKDILRETGISWEVAVPGLEGVGISVSVLPQGIGEDFQITVKSSNPALPQVERGVLSVSVRPDYLGFKYLMLSDQHRNALENFYQGLDELDRLSFLNGFLSVVDGINDSVAGGVTLIVPREREGLVFFRDLFEHVLAATDYDVLGPLENVSPGGGKGTFNFVLRDVGRSRLSRLTPDYISRMIHLRTFGEFNFKGKIRYIFRTMYDYHNVVLPAWNAIQLKLQQPWENLFLNLAEEQMLGIMTHQINKDVTGPTRMAYLDTLFWMLGSHEPEKALEPQQVLRAYFYTMVRFNRFHFTKGKRWSENETLMKVTGQLYRFAASNGFTVSEDLEKEIDARVATELLAQLNERGAEVGVSQEMVASLSSLTGVAVPAPLGLADETPLYGAIERLKKKINDEMRRMELELRERSRTPAVAQTPARTAPLTAATRDTASELPPYVLEIVGSDGETKVELALWVQPAGKGGKPVIHWSRVHADELTRQGETILFTTNRQWRKGPHKLCQLCQGRNGIITQGSPNFRLWDEVLRMVKRGEITAVKVGADGEVISSTTGSSSPASPSKASSATLPSTQSPREESGIPDNINSVPYFGRSNPGDPTSSWKLALAVKRTKILKAGGGGFDISYEIDWNLERARAAWGEDVDFDYPSSYYDARTNTRKKTFTTVGDTPPPEEWAVLEKMRQEGTRFTRGHDVDEDYNPIHVNQAMKITPGGIDLTSDQMIGMRNNGKVIQFNLDTAMLAQFKNTSGLISLIINIQSAVELGKFLGVAGK